jgi:hypothetical protein
VTVDLKEVERRARGLEGWQSDRVRELVRVTHWSGLATIDIYSHGEILARIVRRRQSVTRPAVLGELVERASDTEVTIAHLLGHDLGAPLAAHDAAVLGDHLRELGAAEWRVAAALDVLTRRTP